MQITIMFLFLSHSEVNNSGVIVKRVNKTCKSIQALMMAPIVGEAERSGGAGRAVDPGVWCRLGKCRQIPSSRGVLKITNRGIQHISCLSDVVLCWRVLLAGTLQPNPLALTVVLNCLGVF